MGLAKLPPPPHPGWLAPLLSTVHCLRWQCLLQHSSLPSELCCHSLQGPARQPQMRSPCSQLLPWLRVAGRWLQRAQLGSCSSCKLSLPRAAAAWAGAGQAGRQACLASTSCQQLLLPEPASPACLLLGLGGCWHAKCPCQGIFGSLRESLCLSLYTSLLTSRLVAFDQINKLAHFFCLSNPWAAYIAAE